MEMFSLVFQQMLTMFLIMGAGFFLRKKNILTDGAENYLSKLETFIFSAANVLNNQLNNCSVESFSQNAKLILYGGIITVIAVGCSYPLSRLFVSKNNNAIDVNYRRNIYKYTLAIANFGFIGNYIVQSIWGEEMFFQYSLFTFILSLFCIEWGLTLLIPPSSGENLARRMVRGLLSPPMMGLIVGCVGGLFGVRAYLPKFFMNAIGNCSKCYGPCAMLIAGIVIGGFDLKELVGDKKVYLLAFFRLLLIPAIFAGALKLLHAPDYIVIFTLLAFAVPSGLNTIVYPATYGGETKTGAGMVLISNILCMITLPIMFTVFLSIL